MNPCSHKSIWYTRGNCLRFSSCANWIRFHGCCVLTSWAIWEWNPKTSQLQLHVRHSLKKYNLKKCIVVLKTYHHGTSLDQGQIPFSNQGPPRVLPKIDFVLERVDQHCPTWLCDLPLKVDRTKIDFNDILNGTTRVAHNRGGTNESHWLQMGAHSCDAIVRGWCCP